MRTASLAIAISAGVLGVGAALLILAVGGVEGAFEVEGHDEEITRGLAGIFVGVAAITAGAIALHHPLPSAVIQFVAAIAGAAALWKLWAASGPLLLVGGLLAAWGRSVRAAAAYAALATVVAAAVGAFAAIDYYRDRPDTYTDEFGRKCLEAHKTPEGVCP